MFYLRLIILSANKRVLDKLATDLDAQKMPLFADLEIRSVSFLLTKVHKIDIPLGTLLCAVSLRHVGETSQRKKVFLLLLKYLGSIFLRL